MTDADHKPELPGAYAGALSQIIKGLKSQPALLFGLGGGIILMALAGTVGEQPWMFVVGIVLVLLAALAAWLLGTRAARQGGAARAREIEVGEASTLLSRVGSGFRGRFSPRIRAKDKLTVSGGSHAGSEVDRLERQPPDSQVDRLERQPPEHER